MGLPASSAFPDVDNNARVYHASAHTPLKSDVYSMLLFHLLMGQADSLVIRAIKCAFKSQDRQGLEFSPLSGRRFRFLSEENILEARVYYEELRREYPHLQPQPPLRPDPAERSLVKGDYVALLDWLRPDISDPILEAACAAYAM